MDNNHIALLCTLHPASDEKQERILSLLRHGARSFYRHPRAQCTTWSYFLPLSRSLPSSSTPLVLSGLEVYADKSALESQLDDRDFFQAYHRAVREEGLYRKDEGLVAWYLAEGFLSREEGGEREADGGCFVLMIKFVARREAEDVLAVLRDFVPFVRDEEPGVLTYAAFVRPKAKKEVLLFGRFNDKKAMEKHANAPEHVTVVEQLERVTENDISKDLILGREVEDSFVSTRVGGPSKRSKL